MIKNRSITIRIDVKTISELKKIFPDESPSEILHILAKERIAVQRNIESLFAAKKTLAGKKSNRDIS
jgi:hypothetical protein